MPGEVEQQNILPPELEQAEDQLVESLALALAAIAREMYTQERLAAERKRNQENESKSKL